MKRRTQQTPHGSHEFPSRADDASTPDILIDTGNETPNSFVSIQEARNIMGEAMLGPIEVMEVFGYLPETVPPIPYPKEVLEKARKLGYKLILQVSHWKPPGTIGVLEKLTMCSLERKFPFNLKLSGEKSLLDDRSIMLESPSTGWKLVSDRIENQDILFAFPTELGVRVSQVKALYENSPLPDFIKNELTDYEKDTARLLRRNNESEHLYSDKIAHYFKQSAITGILCERPVEVLYRFILQAKSSEASHQSYALTGKRRTGSMSYATNPGSNVQVAVGPLTVYRDKDTKSICKISRVAVTGKKDIHTNFSLFIPENHFFAHEVDNPSV